MKKIKSETKTDKLIIAAFGDLHGNLDEMFRKTDRWQQENKKSIDLIVQTGDFQGIRNANDFASFFGPKRAYRITDFKKYSDGTKVAPIETIFIGGNHESWELLEQFKDGGFIAPNLYYMGRSDVIERKSIKIGGITGVYSPNHVNRPRPKTQFQKEMKYFNIKDIKKIAQQQVDILIMHEWPSKLNEGNLVERSIRMSEEKFAEDYRNAGNPYFRNLIQTMCPKYAFCGHIPIAYQDINVKNNEGLTKVVCLPGVQDKKGIYVFEYGV